MTDFPSATTLKKEFPRVAESVKETEPDLDTAADSDGVAVGEVEGVAVALGVGVGVGLSLAAIDFTSEG